MKKKIQIGTTNYVNKNCWLVKTIGYPSTKRCRYCELKLYQCFFSQYLIISLISIIFFFTLSFLIEGKISRLLIISIFTLVIIYGYFFNKNTEKIIKAYFAQRKTKNDLIELTKKLEEKVHEQTKKIRKSYEKLEKLDKTKSEFVSIASHQLRTPLTAIKGYISMILEGIYGKLPEKLEKPLKNIYASNERLIRLVNDLLNLSRIETGKTELNLEKVALDKVVANVIEELESMAKKKGIYLKIEEFEKIPNIMIDENKIRQVIMNIIDNAIRYTNKGGITVKIQNLKTKIQIIISDTGEGMTKEEITYLFGSFSRGTAGTKSWTEGIGLGLYVAKNFIKLHNGKIQAESPGKGKGSTFYIEIPIK